MTDHAEVMRIAEGLDAVPETGADPALIQEAADALRRQSAEIERLRAELEALRNQEPVAWMNVRNGFICKKPTNADYQQPLYPAAGAQPAPDANCITLPDGSCVGGLMAGKPPCMHDRPSSAQPAPIQEVYDWPEGATHYQPQQKAFYKRVSACEWYVWSRITDEPLHWSYSPGTMDSAEWIVRAQPAPSVPDIPAMVDAAMGATQHIHPPITRSQCKLIIEAAFAAAPEAPKRKPLTDEEICKALGIDGSDDWTYTVARAVEAAHGIKEQDND